MRLRERPGELGTGGLRNLARSKTPIPGNLLKVSHIEIFAHRLSLLVHTLGFLKTKKTRVSALNALALVVVSASSPHCCIVQVASLTIVMTSPALVFAQCKYDGILTILCLPCYPKPYLKLLLCPPWPCLPCYIMVKKLQIHLK
jgi:hypothetical protein